MLSGEGGKLRAIADIGTHWLDLVQFITGLSVKAVQADLKTVHTTRQRPTGEVETFSAKVQAPEAYDDSFKQSFKSFYDYIAAADFGAPEPFPTFADGHKEILLCEAILESHEGGRWVEID